MYVTNYQPVQSAWNMAGQSGFNSFTPQQAQQSIAQQEGLAQQQAINAQSGLFGGNAVNYSFAPAGQAFQPSVSTAANPYSWAYNPVQSSSAAAWNLLGQQAQAQAMAQQQAQAMAQQQAQAPALSNQQFLPQSGQVGFYGQPAMSWAANPAGSYTQTGAAGQMAPFAATGVNTIQSSTGMVQPRVEIAETNNDIVLTCELPNIGLNDLNLSVADDSLTISGSSSSQIGNTSIHRTVALPTTIKAEQVDASYNNGMLQVRAPKSDISTRRRIKVNTIS